MVSENQEAKYRYRISKVNCWDALNPSSDDFDFPDYDPALRIPIEGAREDKSILETQKLE